MTLLVVPLFIGTTELLLIGGMALLLFGGKKLPELMKGLGQGVQSFKKGMKEPLPDDEQKDELTEEQSEVSAESQPLDKNNLTEEKH